MAGRPGGLDEALAQVEERARVRLHQAANRMEDADPFEVRAAEAVVRVLNLVDRLTGFRARHRAQRKVPEGRPGPPPRIAGSPEWGGLDPARLSREQRLQLRRLWRSGAQAASAKPRGADHSGLDPKQHAAWEAWARAIEAARRSLEPDAQSASGAAESAIPSPSSETS